jgi:hypothetical protein
VALCCETPTLPRIFLRAVVFCLTAVVPIPVISWISFGGRASFGPGFGLFALLMIAAAWGALLGVVAWILAGLCLVMIRKRRATQTYFP